MGNEGFPMKRGNRSANRSRTPTDSPPEPGFARREAHYRTVESGPQSPAHYPSHQPEAGQGGGSRGNQGFPHEAREPKRLVPP